MNKADKGIFFLLLAFICLYLVLDEFYGNKAITNLVVALIPSSED